MNQETQKEKSDDTAKLCLSCKKNPITFRCMPCKCEVLCKKCAMKMASGGKCKVCKQFFTVCRKIINDPEDKEQEENDDALYPKAEEEEEEVK